jgi:hypothetical protein
LPQDEIPGIIAMTKADRVLFDEIVFTSYGQFDLVWGNAGGFNGEWDRFFSGQVNGLVGVAHGDGVYVNIARWGGGSRIRITLAATAPAPASEYYEDVVEVSITIPTDVVVNWETWAATSTGKLDPIDPGSYRVRVSSHGRDAGAANEFAEGIVDEYLIELWPAPICDDQVVRVGSETASYWHRELGRRR